MKKTTVYLTAEQQDQLKDAARRTGKSEALMIREAIAAYVTKVARPWPQSIGMGKSPDDGFDARNTKAFLREHWIKDIEAKWNRGMAGAPRE
jgi:hypothetical protein